MANKILYKDYNFHNEILWFKTKICDPQFNCHNLTLKQHQFETIFKPKHSDKTKIRKFLIVQWSSVQFIYFSIKIVHMLMGHLNISIFLYAVMFNCSWHKCLVTRHLKSSLGFLVIVGGWCFNVFFYLIGKTKKIEFTYRRKK